MREINQIIIHCSATRPNQDIGVDTIRKWHVEGNGWSDIGYHEVIRRNGLIEAGRPHSKAGAHAKGHNKNSIGICLVGGVDKNNNAQFNFTRAQLMSLLGLVDGLKQKYPKAKVIGHNSVSSKECPSFDVAALFSKK